MDNHQVCRTMSQHIKSPSFFLFPFPPLNKHFLFLIFFLLFYCMECHCIKIHWQCHLVSNVISGRRILLSSEVVHNFFPDVLHEFVSQFSLQTQQKPTHDNHFLSNTECHGNLQTSLNVWVGGWRHNQCLTLILNKHRNILDSRKSFTFNCGGR